MGKSLSSRDYQLGMGLEKDGSGIDKPIELKRQTKHVQIKIQAIERGLAVSEKKKKRGIAFDFDCSNNRISIPIPYIFETFIKPLHVLRPSPTLS